MLANEWEEVKDSTEAQTVLIVPGVPRFDYGFVKLCAHRDTDRLAGCLSQNVSRNPFWTRYAFADARD